MHLPKIWIVDSAVDPVSHGSPVAIPGISKYTDDIKEQETVAIMTLKDELVAVGSAIMDSEKIGREEKGVAIKVDAVFMQPGVYPKYRKVNP